MTEGIHINGRFWSKQDISQLHPDEMSEKLLDETFVFVKQWFDENETVVVQTSGTTGHPKSLHVSKHQMVKSAGLTLDYFALGHGHTALLALSPRFIAGKMMIVRAIIGQLKLIVAQDTLQPWKALKSDIDFAALVPLQYTRMMEQEPAACNQFKIILLGGSALSAAVEAGTQTIETKVFHSYGMTETLSHIALRPVNGPHATAFFSPLEGVDIRLDERQCMMIRSPFQNQEWLVTNDLAFIDKNNRFRLLGRIDEVINFAGKKLYPAVVERKMSFLEGLNYALLGVNHPRTGQLPVLAVEASWNIAEIYNAWQKLEVCLHPLEMPKRIVLVSQFPLTSNGKIQRRQLLEIIQR